MLIGNKSKILLFADDTWNSNNCSSVFPTQEQPANRLYFTTANINDKINFSNNAQVIDKHISSGIEKIQQYSDIVITAPLYFADFNRLLAYGLLQNGNAFEQRPPGQNATTTTLQFQRGFNEITDNTKWEIYKGCAVINIKITFTAARFQTATYTIRGYKAENYEGALSYINNTDQPFQNPVDNEYIIDGIQLTEWLTYSINFNFNHQFLDLEEWRQVGFYRPKYGVFNWDSSITFIADRNEWDLLHTTFMEAPETFLEMKNGDSASLNLKQSCKIETLTSNVQNDGEFYCNMNMKGQGDNFFIGERDTIIHMMFNTPNITLPLSSASYFQTEFVDYSYNIKISVDGMNTWRSYTGTGDLSINAPNSEIWIRPNVKKDGWLRSFCYGNNQSVANQIKRVEILDYDGTNPFGIVFVGQQYVGVFFKTFQNCSNLEYCFLMDYINIKDIDGMIYPQYLNIMSYVFSGCSKLKEVLLPVVNVSITNITNTFQADDYYRAQFNGCSQLIMPPVIGKLNGSFTSINQYLQECFQNCSNLLQLPEIPELPDGILGLNYFLYSFAYNCSKISQQMDIPKIPNTVNTQYFYLGQQFYGSGITECPVIPSPKGNISNLEYYLYFTFSRSKIQQMPVIEGFVEGVQNMPYFMRDTFSYCKELTTQLTTIPKFPQSVKNASYYLQSTFANSNITETPIIEQSSFENATRIDSSFTSTFQNCSKLITANPLPSMLNAISPSSSILNDYYYQTFDGCSNMEHQPDIPPPPKNGQTTSTNTMMYLFRNCNKIQNNFKMFKDVVNGFNLSYMNSMLWQPNNLLPKNITIDVYQHNGYPNVNTNNSTITLNFIQV